MTSISKPTHGVLLAALVLWACGSTAPPGTRERTNQDPAATREGAARVHYLEIVTPRVDETCATLAAVHGVSFSQPDPALGHARTASLDGGGRIGVRAPMREDEAPVVRPYLLVDDIEAATEAAEATGAEIAMTATEIPGQGRFAIYILGGIQHGLWER